MIRFYCNRPEQQRLLGFLLDDVARRQGVVMACSGENYETLSDGLEMLSVYSSEDEIARVEITPNLRTSIAAVAAAARNALGSDHGGFGRLFCDSVP